jgi:hypothetical protein
MGKEVLQIIFYRDGGGSAAPLFPESEEQGLAMLAQITRGNLMPGIEADAAELRRGEMVVKFVSLEPEEDSPGRIPGFYFELWDGE